MSGIKRKSVDRRRAVSTPVDQPARQKERLITKFSSLQHIPRHVQKMVDNYKALVQNRANKHQGD